MSLFTRLTGSRAGRRRPHRAEGWFLTRAERGNDATALGPWTGGNAVRAIPHGTDYFSALARELADTGPGDLVLLGGWRVDADQWLNPDLTVGEALVGCAQRGVDVRGLVWRSHPSWIIGSWTENKDFARRVNRAGGQVLLDQRVRPAGSHHQKFVVIRRPGRPQDDVAFVGGLDLAYSRADDIEHQGDRLARDFAEVYGPTPAWHDVQLEIRGPAVRDVEQVFRERWEDPTPLTTLPWHTLKDRLAGLPRSGTPLPEPTPAPPPSGRARVQLLRTYPARFGTYPFAPDGEFSVARGILKALKQARHLVYIEDQYLWSPEVGQALDRALRRNRQLHVVAVTPRFPDQEGALKISPALLGQGLARRSLSRSVRDRTTLLSPENSAGWPVYVHAKLVVIDDVWAAVGSPNLNRRSWTHDSELTVAVLDEDHRFARELRLRLMREHLGRTEGDDADLRDPAAAVAVLRESAAALDAWHATGQSGPRPPGRVRLRQPEDGHPWLRLLVTPLYRLLYDPDGRPLVLKVRGRY